VVGFATSSVGKLLGRRMFAEATHVATEIKPFAEATAVIEIKTAAEMQESRHFHHSHRSCAGT